MPRPHNAPPVLMHPNLGKPEIRSALLTLLKAHEYGQDLGRGAREIALPVQLLHERGCSGPHLQWLTRKGLTHVFDSPPAAQPGGAPKAASIVLTEAGAAVARALRTLLEHGDDGPAAPEAAPSATPVWNDATGELWYRGCLVLTLRNAASDLRTVLLALQNAGWPRLLADPLPARPHTNVKKRLHDTVQNLNRKHARTLFRFCLGASGRAVGWRPRP